MKPLVFTKEGSTSRVARGGTRQQVSKRSHVRGCRLSCGRGCSASQIRPRPHSELSLTRPRHSLHAPRAVLAKNTKHEPVCGSRTTCRRSALATGVDSPDRRMGCGRAARSVSPGALASEKMGAALVDGTRRWNSGATHAKEPGTKRLI